MSLFLFIITFIQIKVLIVKQTFLHLVFAFRMNIFVFLFVLKLLWLHFTYLFYFRASFEDLKFI